MNTRGNKKIAKGKVEVWCLKIELTVYPLLPNT